MRKMKLYQWNISIYHIVWHEYSKLKEKRRFKKVVELKCDVFIKIY